MDQANTVEEFLKILNRYQGQAEVFYRGQAAKYKSVISSISWDNGHLANEHQIYRETLHMYEQEFETIKYPIKRLAKLQHYGIPTRLIDVTIDPLIALYFAVEDHHIRTAYKRPETNGKIERWHRTLKEQKISLAGYTSPQDAKKNIYQFVDDYNTNRPHQAIGHVTPEQKYTGKAEEVIADRKQKKEAARRRRRELNQEVA